MENESSKHKIKLKDRTYQYSIKMIEFLDDLPKDNSAQIISKQLLRSATSIGANIVEAQASSSKIEYLLNETKELAKILGSSILTLKWKNKFLILNYGFALFALSF